MPIPVIRLYTGEDGQSHFEQTSIETVPHGEVVIMTGLEDCHEVQFAETGSGGGYDWHNAPRRQYVITLTGTLEFTNQMGETQVIRPGDILLAEDTTGHGHISRAVDRRPRRSIFVTLD